MLTFPPAPCRIEKSTDLDPFLCLWETFITLPVRTSYVHVPLWRQYGTTRGIFGSRASWTNGPPTQPCMHRHLPHKLDRFQLPPGKFTPLVSHITILEPCSPWTKQTKLNTFLDPAKNCLSIEYIINFVQFIAFESFQISNP